MSKETIPHSIRDKGDELIEKFYKNCILTIAGAGTIWRPLAIKQAIIAVKEIIKADPMNPHDGGYYETMLDRRDDVVGYWNQILQYLKEKV